MNNNQQKLPLPTFCYGVVFLAGIYWGISFHSGAFGPLFAILLPPSICIGMAIVTSGGSTRRIVLGAITLYINFLLTFAIGYGLARAGIIQFSYRSHRINQSESKQSEAKEELLSFANQIKLDETQEDVRDLFQREVYNHLTLLESKSDLWVVKTPFKLFGNNWFLWIQFFSGRVTGVRVRTQRDIKKLPVGAPVDRLSPNQPKEFPTINK